MKCVSIQRVCTARSTDVSVWLAGCCIVTCVGEDIRCINRPVHMTVAWHHTISRVGENPCNAWINRAVHFNVKSTRHSRIWLQILCCKWPSQINYHMNFDVKSKKNIHITWKAFLKPSPCFTTTHLQGIWVYQYNLTRTKSQQTEGRSFGDFCFGKHIT